MIRQAAGKRQPGVEIIDAGVCAELYLQYNMAVPQNEVIEWRLFLIPKHDRLIVIGKQQHEHLVGCGSIVTKLVG